MRHVDYSELPELLQEGMRNYVEHRLMPGGFLQAVLSNDLTTAALTADDINRPRLADIAEWCYDELPIACWGDPEKVSRWLDNQAE